MTNINILGIPRKTNYNPNLAEQINQETEKKERKNRLESKLNSKEKPEEKPNAMEQVEQITYKDTKDYIQLPSGIYVAKQRTHLNKNWFECHKLLYEENKRMLILPEFIELLKYLKNSSNSEYKKIYDEITEKRDPWRSEWLDADFKVINEKLHINYYHILDKKGNLIPQNSEPLEKCLMEDFHADILNPNKQGLPTRKSSNQDFYYWYPRGDNHSVAWFDADSGRVDLGCLRNPSNTDSAIGVRAVKKENKN